MKAVHEHEFEAAHGLPEALPAGETLLWQGSPDWRALAIQVLHVRKLGLYFAALLAWRIGAGLADGAAISDTLVSSVPLAALATLAMGVLLLLAWLMGRTTVYSITDRRVVMRIGIVLTITFNLPLSHIDTAGFRARTGDLGDITLTLDGVDRIAYMHLWPHARPWHLKRTQPMLRALPRSVAKLLAQALACSAGQARPVTLADTASNDARAAGKPALAA